MEPVSVAQYEAATTGGMPEPELIDQGLWSLPVRMPGDFLSYTLSVVHVDDSGAVTIVDPGWESDENDRRIRELLTSVGRGIHDVTAVIVTHAHPDHLGAAERVRDASGAKVYLHEREQRSLDLGGSAGRARRVPSLGRWGVDRDVAASIDERLANTVADGTAPGLPELMQADVLVRDGDVLPVSGWKTLLTPGHTPGHICIVDERRRILFSGDHVLPTVFPGIGLGETEGGNPLREYLDALERLEPFDDFEVVPGHGYRFRGLRARRQAAADHVLRRAREVAKVLAAEPGASVWDIASQLTWGGGWEQLSSSLMILSALAQTDMYREFVVSGGLTAP